MTPAKAPTEIRKRCNVILAEGALQKEHIQILYQVSNEARSWFVARWLLLAGCRSLSLVVCLWPAVSGRLSASCY